MSNPAIRILKQNKKELEESIAYRQKAAQDAGTTHYDIGTAEEKERLAKINAEIDKLEKPSKKTGPVSVPPVGTVADGG